MKKFMMVKLCDTTLGAERIGLLYINLQDITGITTEEPLDGYPSTIKIFTPSRYFHARLEDGLELLKWIEENTENL